MSVRVLCTKLSIFLGLQYQFRWNAYFVSRSISYSSSRRQHTFAKYIIRDSPHGTPNNPSSHSDLTCCSSSAAFLFFNPNDASKWVSLITLNNIVTNPSIQSELNDLVLTSVRRDFDLTTSGAYVSLKRGDAGLESSYPLRSQHHPCRTRRTPPMLWTLDYYFRQCFQSK